MQTLYITMNIVSALKGKEPSIQTAISSLYPFVRFLPKFGGNNKSNTYLTTFHSVI